MSIRPQGWLCLAAVAAFSSGCAVTSEQDASARPQRLPTGVTLLDSDRKECDGSVAIDERTVSNARRSDLVLQRGQNAIIEVDANTNDDDVEIGWTCVGSASAARKVAECPNATSHVRITRDATGDDFLVECYGNRGSSTSRARR
jgi:hypothetical protein